MKGRFYQALTDDPMVDVLVDQGSLRDNARSTADLFEELESYGIDRQRLADAMNSKEPWGKFVHAFEFVTALSVLIAKWPEPTTGMTVIEDDLPGDVMREQYEARQGYEG